MKKAALITLSALGMTAGIFASPSASADPPSPCTAVYTAEDATGKNLILCHGPINVRPFDVVWPIVNQVANPVCQAVLNATCTFP